MEKKIAVLFGDVEKIHEVYDAAQAVLNSLENMQQWQAFGWLLIEDHMIIGLAHAGDIKAWASGLTSAPFSIAGASSTTRMVFAANVVALGKCMQGSTKMDDPSLVDGI